MKRQHTERVPTIREVAKLARVGLMTVSRVINHHPSVRPATRKKVELAIAALGYQQNEAARLLKGQRARMIGLIVPDLSDSFFASCAHTVQHMARQHDLMTLIVASERDADLEVQQAELMASRMVSGLLIVSSTRQGDERLGRLQSSGLPIVAFDRPLPGLETDSVVIENRAGAQEAVEHLIAHGHKHIACAGYDQEVYTIYERIQGYQYGMQKATLKPQIGLGLLTLDDVRSWLGKVLTGKNAPTAIFALNHRTSIFVLQALTERNIKIPEQVALAGFDDFDLSSVIRPALTTVAQSPVELAQRAMGLLLQRIHALQAQTTSAKKMDQNTTPAKIVLPARLIVRQSCGSHPINMKT
ncbi:LacI family DNA-binding transcriptional regulator [Granulicella sp. WH15]|uniref:LacI family DNA-binding transcriptional regulator n=1 Tax=Granulicella sp. WH15 TaxID=2602070 RepID=UPI0021028543|nr:LacI family DNA-binding transcriptional regulator [Granulicella sp. WH15]